MNVDKEVCKISILGEFLDQNLEREFFCDYMARNIKYIRSIVLALGILNTLFIIPDYFFIEDWNILLSILVNRAVFLFLVIIFFFLINKFKNFKLLAQWTTVFEILGSISFLVVFGQYNRPDFLIQAFGVIILILAIFTVPNKWKYMMGSSIFVSIVFFAFSKYSIKELPISEYSVGIVYILIVLVLSGMGAFRANYYNRKQYIYGKELLNLSSTDKLTGIYNRTKCNAELENWLAYAKRYNLPLSVIFFDIDDFKNINDIFGHLTGDKAIVEIVDIGKNIIRKNDVFARWGGDEFMLLLPNTDKQQALNLADRLRTAIATHHFKEVGKITCSFGLTMASENDNVDRLTNRADQLLYTSKLRGKNIVTS